AEKRVVPADRVEAVPLSVAVTGREVQLERQLRVAQRLVAATETAYDTRQDVVRVGLPDTITESTVEVESVLELPVRLVMLLQAGVRPCEVAAGERLCQFVAGPLRGGHRHLVGGRP